MRVFVIRKIKGLFLIKEIGSREGIKSVGF